MCLLLTFPPPSPSFPTWVLSLASSLQWTIDPRLPATFLSNVVSSFCRVVSFRLLLFNYFHVTVFLVFVYPSFHHLVASFLFRCSSSSFFSLVSNYCPCISPFFPHKMRFFIKFKSCTHVFQQCKWISEQFQLFSNRYLMISEMLFRLSLHSSWNTFMAVTTVVNRIKACPLFFTYHIVAVCSIFTSSCVWQSASCKPLQCITDCITRDLCYAL